MTERLQKYIAAHSAYSRRKAEKLIQAGQVEINGQPVSKLGTVINPDQDKIKVAGQLLIPAKAYNYIALNKPIDFVCTRARFRSEKSIYQLIPASGNLVIAGRLDKKSEGLVILTDDGDLVQKLTHPSFQHQKEYLTELDKPLTSDDLKMLRRGIRLEEGLAKADKITCDKSNFIKITLHQGWKRQIRRMLEKIGYRVISLKRTRVGKYQIDKLLPGRYLEIKKNDII
ncbi:rRNA pseudouridine synthase [Patescibacteria group bacterium]|nr:rRNA pseudouridine synthase [Patescibacteria group bacterium]